ncbi:MAG: BMP family ABC transporter substrate-binding protein [Fimbriimonadaceae bacterium]|jgi:basic membrane protein A|nr:BMP family ABC transporter substrate-binding protein [Fimbriimonadaceae bacterium]
MKLIGWLGLAALTLVPLTGCQSGTSSPTAETGSTATTGKKIRVGVVFDRGGLNDKSFNDSANAGLLRAQKELGIEAFPVESKNEADYEANITNLADKGVDLVIAVGINMETALSKVAPNYPNVKFAIVDGTVPGENVRALKFKEEEGSFLVGYLAGLMTKTNKVGFVGGQKIPLIAKFEYGFLAGVKSANPAAELLPVKYTGSWDNVDSAKVAAGVLFGDGADIIYHAAGRAGLGVIRAAEEQKKFAIGVDSDQDDIAPGRVLTSMIKRVDEAVFQTIKDVTEGKFSSGEKVYDLASDGVGVSEMRHTKDLVGAANLQKLEEVRAKIKSGEIKVPSDETTYAAFLATLAR